MTRKDKLLARFLSEPVDFQFRELVSLLRLLGFAEVKTGKTSGSRAKVKNEKRLEFHQDRVISSLKKRFGYEEYAGIPEVFKERADSSLLRAEWKAGELLNDPTPMLRVGERTFDAGDFAAYVEANQSLKDRPRHGPFYLEKLLIRFKSDAVTAYEKDQILKANPDIDQLTKEYRNGLLLFEISNRRVWSRAASDLEGLENFHAKNADKYMWGERSDAWIVTCGPQANVKKIRKNWKKIQDGRLDEHRLNELFCSSDTIQCVRIHNVLAEEGIYPRVDEQKDEPGAGPIYTNPSTKGFVIINEVQAPRPKTLDEARGQVVADYQVWLEEQWIKELDERYPAKINRAMLKELDQ